MRTPPRLAALFALVLALGTPLPAPATTVDGLYEGIGAGDATEAGRAGAAADALRQVVVRVTGRRSAASDPALAALFVDAARYARTFRSAGGNQVSVAFDAEAVEARLVQAGQRLWSSERPLTLVVLVNLRPGAPRSLSAGGDADVRRVVTATAQQRGLPILWPTGMPPALDQARADDAIAGRIEPMRDLARQYGADAVLLGRISTGTILWSWSGPAGEGGAPGAADEGVQALADRFGAQFATAGSRSGQIDAVVRGVRDLGGYAAAGNALAALPNVRALMLEEASGEALRFRVSFEGDAEALRRAARDSGHFVIDDSAPPGGALQLVLRP
ncbi:MAG: DUF2066 domain-containing protein [Proteobacteria bacterium]|nr:DUF2066 domain-containing protein [Pseudomonadota bacterium]